jgi:hypothetical protein
MISERGETVNETNIGINYDDCAETFNIWTNEKDSLKMQKGETEKKTINKISQQRHYRKLFKQKYIWSSFSIFRNSK